MAKKTVKLSDSLSIFVPFLSLFVQNGIIYGESTLKIDNLIPI